MLLFKRELINNSGHKLEADQRGGVGDMRNFWQFFLPNHRMAGLDLI